MQLLISALIALVVQCTAKDLIDDLQFVDTVAIKVCRNINSYHRNEMKPEITKLIQSFPETIGKSTTMIIKEIELHAHVIMDALAESNKTIPLLNAESDEAFLRNTLESLGIKSSDGVGLTLKNAIMDGIGSSVKKWIEAAFKGIGSTLSKLKDEIVEGMAKVHEKSVEGVKWAMQKMKDDVADKIKSQFHHDDERKKARFDDALEKATDSMMGDILPTGFLVKIKDMVNDIYQPGGVPKTLTIQDVLDRIHEEAIRTRDSLTVLATTVKDAAFEKIIRNIELLESRVSALGPILSNSSHQRSHNKSTKEFLEIMKSASYNPLALAEKLQIMVTGNSENFLHRRAMADDFCSKKTMTESRDAAMQLLNRLKDVASVKVILEGDESQVSAEGVKPITEIIGKTLNSSNKYIGNFGLKKNCWTKGKIESLISRVVERDRTGNITKRAEELISILSKWHTTDKLVVIAKSMYGCDIGCTFQEASLTEDASAFSSHNITVVRTPVSISKSSRTGLENLANGTATKKAEFSCVKNAEYFMDKLPMLAYISINDEDKCPTVIRSTDQDSVVKKQIAFDSISGEAWSFADISGRKVVENTANAFIKTKFNATFAMVIKDCDQKIPNSNGKLCK